MGDPGCGEGGGPGSGGGGVGGGGVGGGGVGGGGDSGGGLFPEGGVTSDEEPAQDGPAERARHIASGALSQSKRMTRVLVPEVSSGTRAAVP